MASKPKHNVDTRKAELDKKNAVRMEQEANMPAAMKEDFDQHSVEVSEAKAEEILKTLIVPSFQDMSSWLETVHFPIGGRRLLSPGTVGFTLGAVRCLQ